MLRMNGSALAGLGAPDTRRDLRTGCYLLRGQRMRARVVQGREGDAQCVLRMREGPEADAHVAQLGQNEWRISMVMGMIWARLEFLGAKFPKKDKVCGGWSARNEGKEKGVPSSLTGR